MKRFIDKKQEETIEYIVGDLVLLDTNNINQQKNDQKS